LVAVAQVVEDAVERGGQSRLLVVGRDHDRKRAQLKMIACVNRRNGEPDPES
jgi:hypothetical protein